MRIIFLLFFHSCVFTLFSQESPLLTIEKLGISNRKLSEYNFVPIEKGAFFLSDKQVSKALQVKDSKNNNLSSIYYCSKKKNDYGTPKRLDINFYNHIGSFTVNEKGDFIIFTGRQNETATTYGLFKTEKIKGNWTEPVLVYKNMEQFNFTDPFLSKSKDTILFASDLAGGKGGLDLYYGIGTGGTWEKIENLGSNVNTSDNERFPCLNNTVLYFSSKREGGIGGMDVYANPIEDGKYTVSVLLHSLINSAADDFSVAFEKDILFFSSNRDGSDDIFQLISKFPEFECQPIVPLVRCYEFTEENSELRDSSAFVFKWSMGDGTEYEGLVADHCFKDSGTYTVELNIYEAATNHLVGNEASFELTIEDPDQLEIIVPEILKTGMKLEFKVSNDNLSDSSTYYWDFGDGQYAIGEKVIHNYYQSGTFEVLVGRIYFVNGEELRLCTSKTIRIL